jgi:hypothetical protein
LLTREAHSEWLRRISLFNQDIDVPHVPIRENVGLHMAPNPTRQILEAHIWWNHKMVHSSTCCWLIQEFTFQVYKQ